MYSNLPCQTVHVGLYEMDIKMFSITFYNVKYHFDFLVCTDSRLPQKIFWPCPKVCENLLEKNVDS